MKITRRQLRKLINESIYGSKYYKTRPRDPSMHVSQDVLSKIDPLLSSEFEEDQRTGYQLAAGVQQDELVFPSDGSDPYEETPFKGIDYVDDLNKYNKENMVRILGNFARYLSESDFEKLSSVIGKDLDYVWFGWRGDGFGFLFHNTNNDAISSQDFYEMVMKIASKNMNPTQAEIDQHLGGDTEIEVVHKLAPAIMKISRKTYVQEDFLEESGIGYIEDGEIEFEEPSYESAYKLGKLVIVPQEY